MACCNNNSCAACSDNYDRREMDAYWKRIHKGGPDLSPIEKKIHRNFKHNEKIYKEVDKLSKKIDVLLKGIRSL